ncbi:unnamed protein product [Nippostrongylus brasiliensis]|nr:unnamed protein product [Nippostrongylus brasiliensis]
MGVVGSGLALFGVLANGLLAVLFLTRSNYRHSPFFFLGFVALFDTLFDSTFILLMSVPVNAEYFDNYKLFMVWLKYMPVVHVFSQIFKIASVFCLIMASIERTLSECAQETITKGKLSGAKTDRAHSFAIEWLRDELTEAK